MEINLKNVWHSYDGSTFVLRNIDLLFRNSGVYLIVGPNGSGKTTLLKITSLIIKPSRGENIINGKSFWSLDERERENLRSNIIYVHDKPILVRGNVRHNLELGMKLKKKRDRTLIEYYIDRYKLRDLERKSANKLSAGQAKVITLIRALSLKPEVLILDEPFTFLDSQRSEMLIEDIEDIVEKEKGLVIIATHYMYKELKEISTQQIEIINGEIQRTQQ
ncbi:MAG: ATP-binding cassette domain-containing protein [Fervidicoccaceae archaeon]|jgi:ABC-type multidrug transport system ATPase subunit|nr:MAG: hypothetical protein C0179_03905 [Fervidicoccus sp.]